MESPGVSASHVVAALVALCASSCSLPVVSHLDESDANEVVGALNASGIAATMEPDGERDGQWFVVVGRSDVSGASATLQRLGLPHRHAPGLLAALGDDALISSPLTEHARWSAGTAAELERSLQGLANVSSVRVHLAVPGAQSFVPAEGERLGPTASVLLQYTGSAPPLPPADVQRLVAGAVPGLAAESVEIVMRADSSAGPTSTQPLSRFGPLTVPRRAATTLRIAMTVAVGACLTALGLALLLWIKLRRLQARQPNAELAHAPTGK